MHRDFPNIPKDHTYSVHFVQCNMTWQSNTTYVQQHTSLQSFFCILVRDRHMWRVGQLLVDTPMAKVKVPSIQIHKDVFRTTNRIVLNTVPQRQTMHFPLSRSSMV